MKEIIYKIFNPIPFKGRKARIWGNQIAFLLLLIIILFHQYATTKKVIELDTITIYSNTEISFDIEEVSAQLQKHKIVLRKRVDVFLPTSEKQYNAWTFSQQKGTLGTNFMRLNRIYINPNIPETRTLSQILIHELGHSYLKEKYGLRNSLKFPEWKQEGFCEYISESSTMDIEDGIAILLNTEKESRLLQTNSLEAKQYRYFKYKLFFTYLIENKNMTAEDIFEKDICTDILKAEIKEMYTNKKI